MGWGNTTQDTNSKVRRLDEIRGERRAERSCRQAEASNSWSREYIAKASNVGGQLGLPRARQLGDNGHGGQTGNTARSYGSGATEYKL